jgi:hypothetical protein
MPRPLAPARRIRSRSGIAALACLALGLGLQLVDRSPIVDALGSVLYVVFLGLLILLLWPGLPGLVLASVAYGVATTVELLQLSGMPRAIVDAVPPARLVFGSAFDPLDLVAYAVGAVALVVLHRLITRRSAAASAQSAV